MFKASLSFSLNSSTISGILEKNYLQDLDLMIFQMLNFH